MLDRCPGEVYVGARALAARVHELAAELDDVLAPAVDPLLVGVLAGSVAFLADLSRAIETGHGLAFVAAESLDARAPATDSMRLTWDVREPIRGRDVIVVDDVVDTGLTLHVVLRALASHGPRSLGACVLLDRPYRRIVEDLPLLQVGFTTADVELAGYGSDYRGRYRQLDHVRALAAQPAAAGELAA